MKAVEPIRSEQKILAIKQNLRSKKSPRDYLLFTMGINFALRISDLLKLRAKDILDQNGNLRAYLYIKQQKTNNEIKVFLNKAVIEALHFYLNKAQIYSPEQLLFTSYSHGRPLSRIRAWQMVKKWCADVGLYGHYGTHSLRKTWGYMARKRGEGISVISEKLGHRNEATTRRYVGISADEISGVESRVCL